MLEFAIQLKYRDGRWHWYILYSRSWIEEENQPSRTIYSPITNGEAKTEEEAFFAAAAALAKHRKYIQTSVPALAA